MPLRSHVLTAVGIAVFVGAHPAEAKKCPPGTAIREYCRHDKSATPKDRLVNPDPASQRYGEPYRSENRSRGVLHVYADGTRAFVAR
jgi:hypothetical protein